MALTEASPVSSSYSAPTMSTSPLAMQSLNNDEVDFNEDGHLEGQLRNMIVSDRNGMGRALRSLWFAGNTVNPNLDDEQIGQMLYHWMRKDGIMRRMSLP